MSFQRLDDPDWMPVILAPDNDTDPFWLEDDECDCDECTTRTIEELLNDAKGG